MVATFPSHLCLPPSTFLKRMDEKRHDSPETQFLMDFFRMEQRGEAAYEMVEEPGLLFLFKHSWEESVDFITFHFRFFTCHLAHQ
jgi:hypothetical protein